MVWRVLLASTLLAAIGCGRTMFFDCEVTVAPTSLNFGLTAPGAVTTRDVVLGDQFNGACDITGIGIADGSDPGFAVVGTNAVGVGPGQTTAISVAFAPEGSTDLTRHATLVMQSTDPDRPAISIPLTAGVSTCHLSVAPAPLNFGTLAAGQADNETLLLTDTGTADCVVTAVTLTAQTDPEYALAADQSLTFTLAPMASAGVTVTFAPTNNAPPFVRTGTVAIESNDPSNSIQNVPLIGAVPHCSLGISPPTLDFGNVTLNSTTTDQLTLFNDGGLPCSVTAIALTPDSDPGFSLPSTQPITVPPGAEAQISVTFSDLNGATPPLLHTGTLGFATGDPFSPDAGVPLEAYVNTACQQASQWIYTVDVDTMFSRFDPQTLTFTDIGFLQCPSALGATPFSMAVDQNAVAWVLYDDSSSGVPTGEIFEVNTADAGCQATGFIPNQFGVDLFGMSFVFQPTTGVDTLYVAGAGPIWNSSPDLATIAFPSMVLSPIAPVSLGFGELAGTGDGELWDFIPPEYNLDGGGSVLAQLDPATAEVLAVFNYPNITVVGDFATKFWGGSFWVFLGPQVWQIDRSTGLSTLAIPETGRNIIGAGVSTCAPVQ